MKITAEDQVHFLSPTIIQWLPLFTKKSYQSIILESIRFCQTHKGLLLFGWVIMPDHLHLLARANERQNLSNIVRDFKRHTAKLLFQEMQSQKESRKNWMNWLCKEYCSKASIKNKNYVIWQPGNYAIPIRGGSNDMEVKLNYIHENPVRAGLVSVPEHYALSSAIDYSGGQGLLDIIHI